MCVLILKPALESLHVCSFHKQHMDPPVFTACVFFPQTTYGSTSVHFMCVVSTNHLWIHQCSLYVCSFHKPHMDPLVSLNACSFHKPHMDQPVVIACVFFSTNHTWIHQWSLHVCSFHKPHMDQPESL